MLVDMDGDIYTNTDFQRVPGETGGGTKKPSRIENCKARRGGKEETREEKRVGHYARRRSASWFPVIWQDEGDAGVRQTLELNKTSTNKLNRYPCTTLVAHGL